MSMSVAVIMCDKLLHFICDMWLCVAMEHTQSVSAVPGVPRKKVTQINYEVFTQLKKTCTGS